MLSVLGVLLLSQGCWTSDFIHVSTPLSRSENILWSITNMTIHIVEREDQAYSCIAVITDSLHKKILTHDLLVAMRGSPLFIIEVANGDDTYTLDIDKMLALLAIRRYGCDLIIIYILNGIQMVRLFQFAERYRILDVKVNYLILYDSRLFNPEMHYIWRRFVNVILIKHRNHHHLNLLTLPFPQAIHNVVALKTIDSWNGLKFRKNATLFSNRSNNLKGEILNAVVVVHTPGVSKTISPGFNNSVEYKGVEIEVINALSKAINFKPSFYESDDAEVEKWGRVLGNGTESGLLGEIRYYEADFAIGDLPYIEFYFKRLDMSLPYTAYCLTFLTPESIRDNSWKTLILPFNWEMWCGVLVSLFCVGLIFYAISKMQHPQLLAESELFDTLTNCLIYTYSMMLVVSLPKISKHSAIRMLTGFYWLYCLLVVVAYRASMTAILANPAARLTIDTLTQLANSKIECGAWGEQSKQFFLSSLDESMQKIGEKLKPTNDPHMAIKRVAMGEFAYYENEHFLRELRSQQNKEQKSVHLMKDCAIHMPIGVGMKKNSPIAHQVDKQILRMIETGLVTKWISDAIQKFAYSQESVPQEALMDLKKFVGAFVALGIGFTVACFALLFELIHWRVCNKQKGTVRTYNENASKK